MDRHCDQHGICVEALQLAFCLGGHTRLGAQSQIFGLDAELCKTIAEQAAVFRVSHAPASCVEFKSVGEAIRSTPDGCTICIAPGEYEEEKPICINARVTLIGGSPQEDGHDQPPQTNHLHTHAAAGEDEGDYDEPHGHDWTEDVDEWEDNNAGDGEAGTPSHGGVLGAESGFATPGVKENAVTLRIRSEGKALVVVTGARARVRMHRITLLHRRARAEDAERGRAEAEDEEADGGVVGTGPGGAGAGARRPVQRKDGERVETERPRCIDVLQGVLSLYSCLVRSEEGNGLTVRGSGKALLFNCQVRACGLHGVSAVHGALVEAEACTVAGNKLSGFNAIGRGACVRCIDCAVLANEDGGLNVVDGALALTSLSSVFANRGTGVRALGEGSWAVQVDCVVARNGWHGVSAVQGGKTVMERSKLLWNRGAGVNAFSAGQASVVQSRIAGNRYGIWAQNNGQVRVESSSTGASLEGSETTLAGGRIVHVHTLPSKPDRKSVV